MPTEIKREGTKERIIGYEAEGEEVEEIFLFDKDKNFIGSEWRLIEVPE